MIKAFMLLSLSVAAVLEEVISWSILEVKAEVSFGEGDGSRQGGIVIDNESTNLMWFSLYLNKNYKM